jgi:hypothetical protein
MTLHSRPPSRGFKAPQHITSLRRHGATLRAGCDGGSAWGAPREMRRWLKLLQAPFRSSQVETKQYSAPRVRTREFCTFQQPSSA